MAPRYPRKTLAGSAFSAEPAQPYTQPKGPSVVLTETEVANIVKDMVPVSLAPKPEKQKPVVAYRQILSLSQSDIADLFDKIVTAKVKVPVLGDPSVVEQQIVELKSRTKDTEERLATRTRNWQKFHRPDDMLSSSELERLKREEKKELADLQVEIRALQARLRNWGKHTDDVVGERDEYINLTFGEKHPDIILSETTPVFGWIPRTVEKRIRNASGKYDVVEFTEVSAGNFHVDIDTRYNIENYRKHISLGDEALELAGAGLTWENWTRWENAAICVAISEGLIQPDLEIVSRHPALNRWTIAPDDETDHEEERKQILHTGGGSLGGARIYSRGWRYGKRTGWTHRALESFDATARYRPEGRGEAGEYNDAGPSGWGDGSDDHESYQPD